MNGGKYGFFGVHFDMSIVNNDLVRAGASKGLPTAPLLLVASICWNIWRERRQYSPEACLGSMYSNTVFWTGYLSSTREQ